MIARGEDKYGIVVSELDKHMLNIIDCCNEIKTIFNKLDDQIAVLKTHYSCSAANVLYKQYENYNENYALIVEDLLSYNADLMALKKSYALNSDNLTQNLKSKSALLSAGIDKYKEKR